MFTFLKNYSEKKSLNAINNHLERLLSIDDYKECYLGRKLVKTKNRDNVCLVHFIFEQMGIIKAIDRYGNGGKLTYLFLRDENNNYIKIGDIEYKKINQGIGSEALFYLCEFAQQNNVKYIKGWLAPVDLSNHKERLIHFYKKNGFKIYDNNEDNLGGVIAMKYM